MRENAYNTMFGEVGVTQMIDFTLLCDLAFCQTADGEVAGKSLR